MSFPHGWYDDPKDPAGQRYWDGEAWTEHRRPRRGPAPYQGEFGQPQQDQLGQAQQAGQAQLSQPQQFGQPQQAPQYGQPQYGQQGFGYGPRVPATPDGVPLAGWWKRVGARVLDGIIVFFISLPFTLYFWIQYTHVVLDWERDQIDKAQSSTRPTFDFSLPPEVYKWMLYISLISAVVASIYEVFFLSRSGATPGKKAVGITVRLRDVAGPPPVAAVLKRYGVYAGLGLLGAIPFVGTLFSLGSLLNVLWPLWDDKKQALHDKVAATNVVLGEQPKHR
ncbi:RDD family protein [Kribbella sp. NPDC006257]|uniref:RDD family protein n=1 Tax=Kribbella sp. NPDC006257 TaxID=3156738 RepID=UPI0033B6628E